MELEEFTVEKQRRRDRRRRREREVARDDGDNGVFGVAMVFYSTLYSLHCSGSSALLCDEEEKEGLIKRPYLCFRLIDICVNT